MRKSAEMSDEKKLDHEKAAKALKVIGEALMGLDPEDRTRVVAASCVLADVSLAEIVERMNRRGWG